MPNRYGTDSTTPCARKDSKYKEGRFGSHMRVRLANDGPVTIILDTDELGV